ncbi:MAG: hypothetical protein J6A59_06565 [Lachnospiraceae bacterium]|nr:hypothetical protein [Lachnospiraceae bacterium]
MISKHRLKCVIKNIIVSTLDYNEYDDIDKTIYIYNVLYSKDIDVNIQQGWVKDKDKAKANLYIIVNSNKESLYLAFKEDKISITKRLQPWIYKNKSTVYKRNNINKIKFKKDIDKI